MRLDGELVVGFGVLSIAVEVWKGDVTVGNVAEIGLMLLWGYLFTQLFENEKASLSVRMLILAFCVFLGSSLLKSSLSSGLLCSLSLLSIFLFHLVRSIDQEQALAQAKETVPIPGVHRQVTADLKPVKELIEYLGTLSDGKVDIEDFSPALVSLHPRIPEYVQKALRQLGKYASYSEILQTANSLYLLQRQYRAPTQIITT